VKPNIRVLRAKFSQITGQAITRAINNLVQPDKRVSDAVNVRSELDLRIGTVVVIKLKSNTIGNFYRSFIHKISNT
jgi:DNA topoisomerase IA